MLTLGCLLVPTPVQLSPREFSLVQSSPQWRQQTLSAGLREAFSYFEYMPSTTSIWKITHYWQRKMGLTMVSGTVLNSLVCCTLRFQLCSALVKLLLFLAPVVYNWYISQSIQSIHTFTRLCVNMPQAYLSGQRQAWHKLLSCRGLIHPQRQPVFILAGVLA